MRVSEAIAAADAILPGQAAPDGETDPRGQLIIEVEEFVRAEPEAVWAFIVRWGCHEDEDPAPRSQLAYLSICLSFISLASSLGSRKRHGMTSYLPTPS